MHSTTYATQYHFAHPPTYHRTLTRPRVSLERPAASCSFRLPSNLRKGQGPGRQNACALEVRRQNDRPELASRGSQLLEIAAKGHRKPRQTQQSAVGVSESARAKQLVVKSHVSARVRALISVDTLQSNFAY